MSGCDFTHLCILAIRERKLASRILTDIQDPGLVNGKLASRIFRIQDL